MKLKWATLFGGLVLLFAGPIVSVANAQQISRPTSVVQLTGFADVKDNAKGTLSVENGSLHFVHGKTNSEINATSIEDVVAGSDSQRAVGNTVGMISMAAPYGGGRFLSLFRTKIDTLTIQYRDPNGGLHGAIFTMSTGTADGIKKELLAAGARTTVTGRAAGAASTSSGSSAPKELKQ